MANQIFKIGYALLIGFGLITLTTSTQAQTNTWIGPAMSDWENPTNWSLGVVPSEQDQAIHIDDNPTQHSSVQLLSTTQQIGSLFIDSNDSLHVGTDSILSVSGSLQNAGNLYFAPVSGQFAPHLLLTPSPFPSVALLNLPGGFISMNNSSIRSVPNSPTNKLLWNQSTLEGSGLINGPTIRNEGLIHANVLNERLLIQPSFQGNGSLTPLLNFGTLRASGGAELQLDQWDDITNTQGVTSGSIEAWGDSLVTIANSKVVGGTISTSTAGGVEEGLIQLDGLITLEGVDLNANATFGNSVILSNSHFANRGTIQMDARNARGGLRFQGTNSISGGGTISLSRSNNFFGVNNSNDSKPRLINVDNTISMQQQGFVTIGNELFVENYGVIEAIGSASTINLELSTYDQHFNDVSAWKNRGTLRALNGGQLSLQANHENTPLDNTGGILEFDNISSLSFQNHSKVMGGILRGPNFNSEFFPGLHGEPSLEDIRLEGIIATDDYLHVSGTIENTGTLRTENSIEIHGQFVRLTGGGILKLERVENSDDFDNAKLINVDNTLQLTANNNYVDFDDLEFVNRGTIEAIDVNSSNGIHLTSPHNNGPGLVNSGVIQAINEAYLFIDNSSSFPVQNYEINNGKLLGGKIQAGVNSSISMRSVNGGTLQAAAGGIVNVDDGTLNTPTTPGEMHLLGRIGASNVRFGGTIRNDGQLVMSSNNTAFIFANLIGAGELQLNGEIAIPQNSIFLNGPNHTIVGAGSINSERGIFTNKGRIEANDNNTFYINHYGTAFLFLQLGELIGSDNGQMNITGVTNWSNQGLIESRDSALVEIAFQETLFNRGTIRVTQNATMSFLGEGSNSGQQFINAIGAELSIDGILSIQNSDLVNDVGGTVTGTGQVDLFNGTTPEPRFANHGTLAPGDTTGQLQLFGHYEQSETGILQIELGGNSPDEYDSFSTWSAELAGLLEVSLVDLGEGEFNPQLGDFFEIIELDGGLLTGKFDALLLPDLDSDLIWGIKYQSAAVTLEILSTQTTDLDQDLDIDGSDFLALQRNNPAAITQWQAEFGNYLVSQTSTASVVPEPPSVAMLLCALTLIPLRKKRSRFATNKD